jgi:hypothetical protein
MLWVSRSISRLAGVSKEQLQEAAKSIAVSLDDPKEWKLGTVYWFAQNNLVLKSSAMIYLCRSYCHTMYNNIHFTRNPCNTHWHKCLRFHKIISHSLVKVVFLCFFRQVFVEVSWGDKSCNGWAAFASPVWLPVRTGRYIHRVLWCMLRCWERPNYRYVIAAEAFVWHVNNPNNIFTWM